MKTPISFSLRSCDVKKRARNRMRSSPTAEKFCPLEDRKKEKRRIIYYGKSRPVCINAEVIPQTPLALFVLNIHEKGKSHNNMLPFLLRLLMNNNNKKKDDGNNQKREDDEP